MPLEFCIGTSPSPHLCCLYHISTAAPFLGCLSDWVSTCEYWVERFICDPPGHCGSYLFTCHIQCPSWRIPEFVIINSSLLCQFVIATELGMNFVFPGKKTCLLLLLLSVKSCLGGYLLSEWNFERKWWVQRLKH